MKHAPRNVKKMLIENPVHKSTMCRVNCRTIAMLWPLSGGGHNTITAVSHTLLGYLKNSKPLVHK